MSCKQYDDIIWCGTDYCENRSNGKSDRDKDKRDLRPCPSEFNGAQYYQLGYKKYPQFLVADVFRRECGRKKDSTSNWQFNCAVERTDANKCPNDWCGPLANNSLNYMRDTYCKGTNILNRPGCDEWGRIQSVEPQYTAMLKRECNKIGNMTHQKCQTFCRNNPGECSSATMFCDAHPSDPLCTCLKSPLVQFGPNAPPECFDDACKATGYRTRAMADVANAGCNYVNCNQILTAVGGGTIENVTLQQKCSNEIKSLEEKKAEEAAARARAEASQPKTLEEQARDAARGGTSGTFGIVEPAWKKQYKVVIRYEPLKTFVSIVNDNVPDTDIEIADIELDDIKPLIVFFILIIALITYWQYAKKQNVKNDMDELDSQPLPAY